MPRVGLEREPVRQPPDHPVEAPDLAEVPGLLIASQLADDFQQDRLGELLGDPVEVLVLPAEHEVVAVHQAEEAARGVPEADRAGPAPAESQGLQGRGRKALPLLGRVPGAVQAPPQSAAEPRPSTLKG